MAMLSSITERATQKKLAFSVAEFKRRITDTQRVMSSKGIDTLLVHAPENIYYLTGHRTPGYYVYQCLVLPGDGDPWLLVRRGEVGNVRTYSWTDDFVPIEDGDDPIEVTVRELRNRSLVTGRIGVETGSWFLTAKNYLALTASLTSASVVPSDNCVEECRLIKSQSEIEYVRRACRSTEAAMTAGIAAIREGATENDAAAAIFAALVQSGCEHLAMEPFVSTGPRSGLMHSSWEGAVFHAGATQLIEIGATVGRYTGALLRTTVIGPPSDQVRRLADVCLEALGRAIEAAKPGATSGEVDEACRGVIERAGLYDLFRKRTGYSVGIGFAPDWGEGHIFSLQRNEPRPLEANMVFHIPPILRIFAECGVGFSETVLVTEGGCEVLTDFDRELIIR
jgi:Xaa-Pro dipeptidase